MIWFAGILIAVALVLYSVKEMFDEVDYFDEQKRRYRQDRLKSEWGSREVEVEDALKKARIRFERVGSYLTIKYKYPRFTIGTHERPIPVWNYFHGKCTPENSIHSFETIEELILFLKRHK